MAIRGRIDPIASFVKVVTDGMLGPKGRSAAIARFARTQLAQAQRRNAAALGRTPPHETFVDGRKGARLETVRPAGGEILFVFELLDDMLEWIGETLVQRSPVLKGDYVRGHRFFADGVELRPGEPMPPNAAELVFLNIVPYARKIEIGKTEDGRDFVIQVENRIYARTAAEAARRFGNMARIKFSYRSPLGAYRAAGTAGAALSRRGGAERATRSPAIVITPR